MWALLAALLFWPHLGTDTDRPHVDLLSKWDAAGLHTSVHLTCRMCLVHQHWSLHSGHLTGEVTLLLFANSLPSPNLSDVFLAVVLSSQGKMFQTKKYCLRNEVILFWKFVLVLVFFLLGFEQGHLYFYSISRLWTVLGLLQSFHEVFTQGHWWCYDWGLISHKR